MRTRHNIDRLYATRTDIANGRSHFGLGRQPPTSDKMIARCYDVITPIDHTVTCTADQTTYIQPVLGPMKSGKNFKQKVLQLQKPIYLGGDQMMVMGGLWGECRTALPKIRRLKRNRFYDIPRSTLPLANFSTVIQRLAAIFQLTAAVFQRTAAVVQRTAAVFHMKAAVFQKIAAVS